MANRDLRISLVDGGEPLAEFRLDKLAEILTELRELRADLAAVKRERDDIASKFGKLLDVVRTYVDLRDNHPNIVGQANRDLMETLHWLDGETVADSGWPAVAEKAQREYDALLRAAEHGDYLVKEIVQPRMDGNHQYYWKWRCARSGEQPLAKHGSHVSYWSQADALAALVEAWERKEATEST